MQVTCVSYLKDLFDREKLEVVLNRMRREIRQISHAFDAIAIRGYSQSLISPILAYEFKKQVIIVRKRGEANHSMYSVEGTDGLKYIIVDDQICSGTTARDMVKEIKKELPSCEMKGMLLYGGWCDVTVEKHLTWMQQASGQRILNTYHENMRTREPQI